MNERIRGIAKLSIEHADSYDDRYTPIWFQFYNEKFAELIVRECSLVCRSQTNEYALELDRENCASAIEEHFEVEDA